MPHIVTPRRQPCGDRDQHACEWRTQLIPDSNSETMIASTVDQFSRLFIIDGHPEDRVMPWSTAVFLTWTTYGTWLPGDSRGWNLSGKGRQITQPLLERWVEGRLRETPLFLSETQQAKVGRVCRRHASIGNWCLHAMNVRTNHIHIVVMTDKSLERTRDEFKA
jgi:hypothetical protein